MPKYQVALINIVKPYIQITEINIKHENVRGLPNALQSGLRMYRHWTEEDVENHLSHLHAPLNKIIRKVGAGFSGEKKFTEDQIKTFEESIVLKD